MKSTALLLDDHKYILRVLEVLEEMATRARHGQEPDGQDLKDLLEFLERFKASPDLRAIPVIIISNLGSRDDVDKGLAMGADAYLVKSNIFPEDVIRKVNAVLRKNNEG